MDGLPIAKPSRASVPRSSSQPAAADERLDVLSDERLVEQLRRGNQAAGEVLVKRHHESLLRYLNRQAGSPTAAEELLQQTWLSALDHLDQFKYDEQGGVGFKAWLFRIATNKAHDQWRSRGRERNAYAGLKLMTDEEVPDASHRLQGREQDEKLRQAIDQLPDAQKQVVLLRYYSGMKFVEIAQMLGCPLNTALGRMHKAMIKLKKLIEP
jgi:RNA polymerase sigma-70 factor (ECF subfamily)